MIRVFLPEDKSFTTNGEVVLRPSRAFVNKVDNGDYYLDLEASIDYVEFLKAGNIIVADTKQGEQAFRISTQIETTPTKVILRAYHVYYDSEEYIIKDSYVVSKNCNDALNHLNDATDIKSPFTVSSDVPTIASYRCVRNTLAEAINEVLARWGGHLVRNNWEIRIDGATGKDNGVIIQYRKNLKDIRVTEDWSAVCTKILPVGKDGQLLPETYIYSQVQYSIPYTKVISFDQDIEEESYPSHEDYIEALIIDLREKARAYVEVSCYPEINYTIEADVERITDTGDFVRVYDERLGIALDATVISFEYNCLTGKYDKVEFGTLGKSLSNLIGSINTAISSSVSSVEQDWNSYLQASVEVAKSEIWNDLSAGYVLTKQNEILVVDTLPAVSASNVIKINRYGISFSHNGINGSFSEVISIDNVIHADHTTVRNLALNSLTIGNLTIGYNLGTSIIVKNISGNTIAVIDASGIKVNNKNVYDSLYLSSGKTQNITNEVVTGFASTDGRKLVFTLPLPKMIDNASASVTTLKLNARGVNGAIFPVSASGYNVISDPDLTVTSSSGDSYVTVTIEASSSLVSNGDTPVSIEVVEAVVAFS